MHISEYRIVTELTWVGLDVTCQLINFRMKMCYWLTQYNAQKDRIQVFANDQISEINMVLNKENIDATVQQWCMLLMLTRRSAPCARESMYFSHARVRLDVCWLAILSPSLNINIAIITDVDCKVQPFKNLDSFRYRPIKSTVYVGLYENSMMI